MALNNVLGLGDRLRLVYSKTSGGAVNYLLALTKPLAHDMDYPLTFSAFKVCVMVSLQLVDLRI